MQVLRVNDDFSNRVRELGSDTWTGWGLVERLIPLAGLMRSGIIFPIF